MINVKDIEVKDLYKKDVPINQAYVGDDIVYRLENYVYTLVSSTTIAIPATYSMYPIEYKYESYKQLVINEIVQEEKIPVDISVQHDSGEQFYEIGIIPSKNVYTLNVDTNPNDTDRIGYINLIQKESNKILKVKVTQRASTFKRVNCYETDNVLEVVYNADKYSSAIEEYKQTNSIKLKVKVHPYIQVYRNNVELNREKSRNKPAIKKITYDSTFDGISLSYYPESTEFTDDLGSRCAYTYIIINRTSAFKAVTLNTKCSMIVNLGGTYGIDYTSQYGYISINITDNDITGTCDCYYRQ